MRLPILAVVFLAAAPAQAQLDAWRSLGEEALHSSTFANFNGHPGELFAPCDKGGKLSLPKLYSADYDLTDRDRAKISKGLQAAKKYANIQEALKDGYLPSVRGFSRSVGLAMVHPDLVRDGTFNLDRPDVLTYVKKKGSPQFRIVGMIYVAGQNKPNAMGDFDERSRPEGSKSKASTDSWDYDEEVCVIVKPNHSVGLYYGPAETPHNCKEGVYYKRLWRLYTWGLVYNPKGLFAEANPMVDYIDRSQVLGPLCSKGKK